MSAVLLDSVQTYLRARFTRQQVAEVKEYGGQFSAEEVDHTSFSAPALLPALMGWTAPRGSERMLGRGVRVCHLSAFVVTKGGKDRADRMKAASMLADRLTLALEAWVPTSTDPAFEIAAPELDIRAENLYGRKLDAKGLALWLVSWRQCVKFPPLGSPAWNELDDLLAVEITSHATHIVSSDDAPVGDLPVTHELDFQPQIV